MDYSKQLKCIQSIIPIFTQACFTVQDIQYVKVLFYSSIGETLEWPVIDGQSNVL